MKSFSANIARGIRLRLKTGYLKEDPAEYVFMKRYPPVTGNRANVVRPMEAKSIPYLKLYDKIIKRNPLYVDERVYPAYWEQDVTPLAIAKRQYDLMQQGLPEDEAFYKAKEYVEELEGKAYDEMEALTNAALSMGATSSFATDETVAAEIAAWREKLADVAYSDLSLADQGEIDYLIHSKILRWNPVQTEIRMKDPVFYSSFRELRAVIFPQLTEMEDELASTMPKESNMDYERTYAMSRRTSAPFYYEEYAELFGQLKSQPMIGRWYSQDREKLSEWIYKSLAIREAADEMLGVSMQRYMDDVREQFFPMVRFPDAAASFELPSPEQFREILFANGVGYRSDNSGLFVRRFYKIPRLLFPAETFAAACAKNADKTRHYLNDPYLLSLALEKEGYPASLQPLVTDRLSELQRSMDQNYRPGSGFGGMSYNDISADASDEISKVLEGSLFDELEDSLLSGGKKDQPADHAESRLQPPVEETKAHKQMVFVAALASNWRCVLSELDTPGMYEALDKVIDGEDIKEVIAEARAKDSPLEPLLERLARVVDEDAIALAASLTDQIDEAGLDNVETTRTLKNQAYRRAFVHRTMEVFSFYYTLKDDPNNSGISFPLDMPFQELDYSHGLPLFHTEEEVIGNAPSVPVEIREKEFKKSLRQKLGSLLRPERNDSEAPVPTKDDMSPAEWEKIAKKYYTPPKSKLEHVREEWISNLSTKEGTTWERMQDLKDEDSLKFVQRKRLDVQLVVRGQLSIEFENKEGARRQREFKRRGVHLNVHPYPLECMDN